MVTIRSSRNALISDGNLGGRRPPPQAFRNYGRPLADGHNSAFICYASVTFTQSPQACRAARFSAA